MQIPQHGILHSFSSLSAFWIVWHACLFHQISACFQHALGHDSAAKYAANTSFMLEVWQAASACIAKHMAQSSLMPPES